MHSAIRFLVVAMMRSAAGSNICPFAGKRWTPGNRACNCLNSCCQKLPDTHHAIDGVLSSTIILCRMCVCLCACARLCVCVCVSL